MIVVKDDKIPNQKIVKVIGNVKIRLFGDYSKADKYKAMKKLVRKAKAMSADAIINFNYKVWGLPDLEITTFTGLAVKTDFIIPPKQLLSKTVCWSCGTPTEKEQRYCRECFAKLT